MALLIILSSSLLLASGFVFTVTATTAHDSTFIHPRGAPLAPRSGPVSDASIPAAVYDEQLGTSFIQPVFASMLWNVTAVAQSDSYGYGPAYLLNGLTPAGFWYQVGLSYDWAYQTSGYNPGFAMNYDVFNSSGGVVLPATGGGGVLNFSGTIDPGDIVLLRLSFTASGNVLMLARDWRTGASASVSYSAEGAQYFQGTNGQSDSNGFFTGLMTEQYHPNPYYGDEQPATYSDSSSKLASAWDWIDEYNPTNKSWTGGFFDSTSSPVLYNLNPDVLQPFSAQGVTEYSDRFEFVTGSLPSGTTSITLLPASKSAPLSSSNEFEVSYTSGGASLTAYAGAGTLRLNADPGTTVVIAGTSTGSNLSEEWVLDSGTTPVNLSAGTTATYYYYDLLSQTTYFDLTGGLCCTSGGPPRVLFSYISAPPSPSGIPSLTNASLSATARSSVTLWAVRETAVSAINPVIVNSSERWATLNSGWTILGPNKLPSRLYYYDQFLISVAFLVVGGGTPAPPPFVYQSLGNLTSVELASQAQTVWADGGSTYSVPSLLNGSAKTERWHITADSALIDGPISLSLAYHHQFFLDTGAFSPSSVTAPPTPGAPGWYDYGTSVVAIYDNVWNSSSSGSRLNAVGFSVDGGADTAVTRADNGTFSVTVVMDRAHQLSVSFVTQYFVAFSFSNDSGSAPVFPTEVSITSNGRTKDVPVSGVWLDNGTSFVLSRIGWEGVDVRPVVEASYVVAAPLKVGVLARVYDATVRVTDILGQPVEGAQTTLTLANGTRVSGTTGSEGSLVLRNIPIGTFSGTVSDLGASTQISGDASTQAVTTITVLLSISSLFLMVGVALVAAVGLLLVRRRHGERDAPPSGGAGQSTANILIRLGPENSSDDLDLRCSNPAGRNHQRRQVAGQCCFCRTW